MLHLNAADLRNRDSGEEEVVLPIPARTDRTESLPAYGIVPQYRNACDPCCDAPNRIRLADKRRAGKPISDEAVESVEAGAKRLSVVHRVRLSARNQLCESRPGGHHGDGTSKRTLQRPNLPNHF